LASCQLLYLIVLPHIIIKLADGEFWVYLFFGELLQAQKFVPPLFVFKNPIIFFQKKEMG
jgi:hypothetical protein